MKQEKVINSLIRFMKEENIYKTVVNSLKYYYRGTNAKPNLYDCICNSSFKGEYAYNLFEWCFRLDIIKMRQNHNPTYLKIKDANTLGKLYSNKWKRYCKKNKMTVKHRV